MWIANPKPGNLVLNSIVSVFLDDGFRYRLKCIVTKFGGESVTLKVDGIFADDAGTEVRGGEVCEQYSNRVITVPVAAVWPAEATFATLSGL
jgi:hypothetical protein